MPQSFFIRFFRQQRFALTLILALFLSASTTASSYAQSSAEDILQAALDAMGGQERLESVTSLRFTGAGYKNALEQSERPEGPYLTQYQLRTELRDVTNHAVRQHTITRSLWQPQGASLTFIHADGMYAMARGEAQRPYPPTFGRDIRDALLTSPERVLLHAHASDDLRVEPDVILQGMRHNVLAFTVEDIPMRVYLHAYTHLPTAVDYERPSYFDVWGDATYRVLYSLWQLEENGIRYPHQWDTEHNGFPYRSFTIMDLELNPGAPADSFAIAEETKTAYAQVLNRPGFRDVELGQQFGQAGRPAAELAEGIIEIPGAWDVVLVEQADGIVIVETPISSEYSEQVLAEAERRFPGKPIKGVISTSDAWPHIGGVRSYVASGIPIYALDLNLPILQRLIDAPYAGQPDRLEQERRLPNFQAVSGRIQLGEGPNRLELYPIRGEGGERMLMVHFPGHNLLYGADLVQRQRDGTFFMPQYLSELVEAADREGLTVENAFAMHIGVTAWSEILDAIAEASGTPLKSN